MESSGARMGSHSCVRSALVCQNASSLCRRPQAKAARDPSLPPAGSLLLVTLGGGPIPPAEPPALVVLHIFAVCTGLVVSPGWDIEIPFVTWGSLTFTGATQSVQQPVWNTDFISTQQRFHKWLLGTQRVHRDLYRGCAPVP